MTKYKFLATISLMFNVFSFSHLLFNIYKTQNASSFSVYYLVGNLISQTLLTTYGIMNKAPEIYYPTILLFSGLLYISFVKIKTEYLQKQQKEKKE